MHFDNTPLVVGDKRVLYLSNVREQEINNQERGPLAKRYSFSILQGGLAGAVQ